MDTEIANHTVIYNDEPSAIEDTIMIKTQLLNQPHENWRLHHNVLIRLNLKLHCASSITTGGETWSDFLNMTVVTKKKHCNFTEL